VARKRHGLARTLTIGELVAGTDALPAGLAAAGATAERPIVCWLPNRLEWLPLVAAAARLGVPIIGLNTRYRADELGHALPRSTAGVLVAVEEVAGIRCGPRAAEAGAGSLRSVVVLGDDRDAAWDGSAAPCRNGTSWRGRSRSTTRRPLMTCSSRSRRPAPFHGPPTPRRGRSVPTAGCAPVTSAASRATAAWSSWPPR
jgi:acyl-CoA synthetase (AMP-forming)/AMP-acid ligase II